MDRIPDVTDQEWSEVNEWNRKITEEFLEQGHLSNQTLRQYSSLLKIFFRWVKDNSNNKPLYELKAKDALRYQNFLLNRELSSSAIKLKRSSVSSLCNYIELYYCDEYPTFRNIYNKSIPNPPKAYVHEKQPLSPEEYKLLIDTLEQREKWQMLAYVKFTYSSACRKAESRQLLKDVITHNKVKDNKGNEKNYYLTGNIRCKGRSRIGKVRRLQFDEEAMNAIKKWLEYRGEDDCPYVFVTSNKGTYKQVSENTFNEWCTNLFSKIVGRRVYPHLFRSTRATTLTVNESKDIKVAQKLLGHESPETTSLYIIRNDDKDIDDAF